MQGVFLLPGHKRPKTKKQLKEAVAANPSLVMLEATSVVGTEYGGMLSTMPERSPAYVVGPDPYTNRKWYATITRVGKKVIVK